LHHVDDQRPGLRRVRWRLSFRIVDPGGAPVRDVATLARIKALGLLQPLDPTVTAGREAMVD
jgi:DNA topoisomerase IB